MAAGPSQACRDFLELAEIHSRKWQRALNYEQEQRVHLEETIEQLAKQHNSLERAFCNTPGGPADPSQSFSEGAVKARLLGGWVCSCTALCPLFPAGSTFYCTSEVPKSDLMWACPEECRLRFVVRFAPYPPPTGNSPHPPCLSSKAQMFSEHSSSLWGRVAVLAGWLPT